MILCVIFLRGVGIVGETPAQDQSVHRKPEDGSVEATDNLKAENHSP